MSAYNAQAILLGGMSPGIPALSSKIAELVLLGGFGVLTTVPLSGVSAGSGVSAATLQTRASLTAIASGAASGTVLLSALATMSGSTAGSGTCSISSLVSTRLVANASGAGSARLTLAVVASFAGAAQGVGFAQARLTVSSNQKSAAYRVIVYGLVQQDTRNVQPLVCFPPDVATAVSLTSPLVYAVQVDGVVDGTTYASSVILTAPASEVVTVNASTVATAG